MRIETNAANRKDVVKAVSGILGQPAKYLGVPTCAYQIGDCTIDKKGAVVTEDEKTAELVTAGLTEQGFIGSPEPEADETTVSLPMEGMTAEGLKNLIFLTHSKQYLINRAFAEEVFRIPAELAETLGSTEIPDTETFLQTFQSHAEGCKGISFQDGKITFHPSHGGRSRHDKGIHAPYGGDGAAGKGAETHQPQRDHRGKREILHEDMAPAAGLRRQGWERGARHSDEKPEREFRFPYR